MNPTAKTIEQVEAVGQIADHELLGELLFGPALMLPGSELSDEALISASSETFPGRSFCIVRVWMLFDVELSSRHVRLLVDDGLSPTVLYANKLVYAVDPQSDKSHGVLSGFQRRYEDCFFETEDMIFVLAGRGSRKTASISAVSALSEKCGGQSWR
jgi:hypothetical protein